MKKKRKFYDKLPQVNNSFTRQQTEKMIICVAQQVSSDCVARSFIKASKSAGDGYILIYNAARGRRERPIKP